MISLFPQTIAYVFHFFFTVVSFPLSSISFLFLSCLVNHFIVHLTYFFPTQSVISLPTELISFLFLSCLISNFIVYLAPFLSYPVSSFIVYLALFLFYLVGNFILYLYSFPTHSMISLPAVRDCPNREPFLHQRVQPRCRGIAARDNLQTDKELSVG